MKINKIVVSLIFIVSAYSVEAQNLSGTIKNKDGEPLIGATLWWEGANVGVSTNLDGEFKIHRVKEFDTAVVSYVGYASQSIVIDKELERLDVVLAEQGVDIESVVVNSGLSGNFIKQSAIGKEETISFAGLCKMACCNLAESFENSAAVTVGYSDAISGARQIKMLGLAGTYTQILDENRPIMRGLSSPYGLSYTPGMWLNSIQVSKGLASVTAGHEGITGQINLEHRKPTDEEKLFLNLYINDELRPEMNISTAQKVGKSGKLSTVLLAHVSADTSFDFIHRDHNGDRFRDMPLMQQYNIANRWSYITNNGVQIRWGVKALSEERLGGDVDYTDDMRADMLKSNIYGSKIQNRALNGYLKVGTPIGRAVYDTENETELRSNIAFVADFDHFDESAYFGLNDYSGIENSMMFNAMYNHYFTAKSSLIVGLSSSMKKIDETLLNDTPWLNKSTNFLLGREENEVGTFAEYTLKHGDIFSLVLGLRYDYNSYSDRSFVTPRGQLKWSITPTTTLRTSAGVGSRISNIITDNIGILATGRAIVFDKTDSKFDTQERAYTFGGSLTQQLSLLEQDDATISFDYFRTSFINQVIVDQERDDEYVHVYSSQAPASTDTYQLDFSWKPFERFDVFATYRHTSSEMTLIDASGAEYTAQRPLVSESKALVNLQYATNMRRWTFDVTAQLNGPSRLPEYAGGGFSPTYPIFFAQVSHRVRDWDLYAGCENIGNYTQKNVILNADNPFSSAFNSSAVWGPIMGRKFYLGVRFNLY